MYIQFNTFLMCDLKISKSPVSKASDDSCALGDLLQMSQQTSGKYGTFNGRALYKSFFFIRRTIEGTLCLSEFIMRATGERDSWLS